MVISMCCNSVMLTCMIFFQPILAGQAAPPALTISLDILETLCKVVPGLAEAGYMKAKAQFLAGTSSANVLSSFGRECEKSIKKSLSNFG